MQPSLAFQLSPPPSICLFSLGRSSNIPGLTSQRLFSQILKADFSSICLPRNSTLVQYVDDLLLGPESKEDCQIDAHHLLLYLDHSRYETSTHQVTGQDSPRGPGFLPPLDPLIWRTSKANLENPADSQRHAKPHFMDKTDREDFSENKTNFNFSPCTRPPVKTQTVE